MNHRNVWVSSSSFIAYRPNLASGASKSLAMVINLGTPALRRALGVTIRTNFNTGWSFWVMTTSSPPRATSMRAD